jgi:predicted YcjX-like family ATPase
MPRPTPPAILRRLAEPNTVRIAVTGLRRCGKTVFTTSFVHNLMSAGQWPDLLPFLKVAARGDLIAAEVFPLAGVPMFPFEASLAAIVGGSVGGRVGGTGTAHTWPSPTDRLCGLRVSLRYRSRRPLHVLRGRAVRKLNIELVDYPGEWLLDLPLLAKDFATWSTETLALTARAPRARHFGAWHAFLDTVDPLAPADPATLKRAAGLYAAALRACAAPDVGLTLHQPARLLRSAEIGADDALLELSPLPALAGATAVPASSAFAAMAVRYDAYRSQVVAPFYRDHFRFFDAQIVLVDVLGALKAGQAAFDDMRAAIAAILQSFDYSRSGFRAWLEGALTERVLFAATKADHVSSNQHPNLRRLLQEVVARETNRIRFRGVETETLAISSVRCTEDVVGEAQGQTLSLVRGMPVGRDAETALFPGEIPAHFPGPQDWKEGRFRFLDFLPVHVSGARGIPHIGLDEAIEGLVGKRLR